MKKLIVTTILSSMLFAGHVFAANYKIDTEGAHASVNFVANHLGVSMLAGRFDDFNGTFTWDSANPSASTIDVTIQTKSINTNHAERDKHFRTADYFAADTYPTITFKGTKFETTDGKTGKMHGQLTMHGTTKDIVIDVKKVGEAEVMRAYRVGFEGTTTINGKDYGFSRDTGPVKVMLYIEGHRQ